MPVILPEYVSFCYSNSLYEAWNGATLPYMKEMPTALSLREIDMLFSPFQHRKLVLRSRLVMAPLPRRYAVNGVPTPEMLLYYTRRAEHMVGLVVTEPVAVNDAAADDVGMAHFYGGAALRGWKSICRAVHAMNCRMAPQLCHVGMLRSRDAGAEAIGPSGIHPVTLAKTGETMSRERIREVVQAFGDAAYAARQLGFDAVEINGGHGCLIDQFLRAETNHRSDEYGGDAAGRVRFAREVVHAVRKAVGRRFPVIFRLSQQGIRDEHSLLADSPAALTSLLRPLCEAGVDIFACSGQGAHEPAFHGSPLSLAGWTRLLSQRPVITDGGVGLPEFRADWLARQLRAGEIDLVAVGRALLADAEWGSKVQSGNMAAIQPFSPRAWARLF